MDSTNQDTEERIQSLFSNFIAKNHDKKYLQTDIDKNAASYYEAPQHPQQAYFSFIDTDSVASLETYLAEFWSGAPEFSGMVHDLSELAFQLIADHNTQSGDVSSFVYTMY